MSALRLNVNSSDKDQPAKPSTAETPANTFQPRRLQISGASRQINISKNDQPKPGKKGSKIFKILAVLLVLAGIAFAVWYFLLGGNSSEGGNPFTIKKFTKTITKVVIPDFKQDKNGYTNILLVGKDTREFSKGLQNTDTVIVASYNDKTGEVLLVSIPRDTFIEYPGQKGRYGRINGIYGNYFKKDNEKEAMSKLAEVATDVTGLEIQYWAMVDLAGFKKAIDIVGGVDVDVETAFTDYAFPADGTNGYRTVSFQKGVQHMDGATALDYARSRKGCCGEGSDFARARRQQKVIAAFIDKLVSIENLNFDKAIKLKESFDKSVTYSEFDFDLIRAGLARLNKVSSKKVTSIVLDPALKNGTLIYHPPLSESGGAYAIWAIEGLNKWSKVQAFILEIIKDPALYREEATVYTYNGGLGYAEANSANAKLAKQFSQVAITFGGNNNATDVTDVVILVSKEKPETLKRIKKYLEDDLGYSVSIVRGISDFKAKHSEDISIVFGAKAPATTEPETETTE